MDVAGSRGEQSEAFGGIMQVAGRIAGIGRLREVAGGSGKQVEAFGGTMQVPGRIAGIGK